MSKYFYTLLLVLPFLCYNAMAQTSNVLLSPGTLKGLSIEELMNIEVTLVSRKPEKILRTASSIQVITQEDIHRYGVTRLPEALRLASNLFIAQTDPSEWAISARGFNGTLANKLLVLIDGRVIYTPLFAGVFWDIQDVFLEDVERIEVISGPGGTLWGANAVNGVINVVTKDAKKTVGHLAEIGIGSELERYGGIRYGDSIAPGLFYRVYGKFSDRQGTVLSYNQDTEENWQMGQGGFRMDWEPSQKDDLTLQGDIYDNRVLLKNARNPFTTGGNLLGRWTHKISDSAEYRLQLYFDRVHRAVPLSYDDVTKTYDVDFQYRLLFGKRHDIVWGLGYRMAKDNFEADLLFNFVPPRFSLPIYSGFIQDEISIIKDTLNLIVGTKVLHNVYTGLEVQPSIRTIWNFHINHALWAAISRAVRTPSRIERDFQIPNFLDLNPNYRSEKLIAYEAGYRTQPVENLYLLASAFYHDYDDIRSLEPTGPPQDSLPMILSNGLEGETFGIEIVANYQITKWWQVRAGYTEMEVDIRAKPESADTSFGERESADPHHYLTLRSAFQIGNNTTLAPAFRYVSEITNSTRPISGYSELNLSIAWKPTPNLELSIWGRNLLHDQHLEFGEPGERQEIERSIFFKIQWTL